MLRKTGSTVQSDSEPSTEERWIYLCPVCGGSGLKPALMMPEILDVPAEGYTDKHTCPNCKGKGTDPAR